MMHRAAGVVPADTARRVFHRRSPTARPTLSHHHLTILRQAGIVESERRGLWAYPYVLPDALKELTAWLS
jgi:hypothetical protein